LNVFGFLNVNIYVFLTDFPAVLVMYVAAKNHAGHFTQVIWKSSQKIGVGRAITDNGQTVYVVCNYLPAGNVTGRYKDNVLPAK